MSDSREALWASRARAAVAAASAITAQHPGKLGPWLAASSHHFALLEPGADLAWTALMSPAAAPDALPLVLFWGVGGPGPKPALAASAAHLSKGLAEDDLSGPHGHFRWQRAPVIVRGRHDLDASRWNDSSLARYRHANGLHDFCRVVVPLSEPEGPRLLVVQVDSTNPAWAPSEGMSRVLLEVAGVLASAYHTGFVEPMLRREGLLRLLSPAQRELAPLLAEGLTEREAAEQTGRSIHTVHEHAKAIYHAWGVRSRMEMRDLWLGVRSPSTSLSGA
ncbi:MAG: helix-turn-helix transcriptional regulator [Planctomycetota bacterium]|nr:helix-turn-helix transcriptional regulator [Planctomycetota bacterium]